MSLTSLECQVSELVASDTCPRPTTQGEQAAAAGRIQAVHRGKAARRERGGQSAAALRIQAAHRGKATRARLLQVITARSSWPIMRVHSLHTISPAPCHNGRRARRQGPAAGGRPGSSESSGDEGVDYTHDTAGRKVRRRWLPGGEHNRPLLDSLAPG